MQRSVALPLEILSADFDVFLTSEHEGWNINDNMSKITSRISLEYVELLNGWGLETALH